METDFMAQWMQENIQPPNSRFIVSFKWRDSRVMEAKFASQRMADTYAMLLRAEGYDVRVFERA